MPADIPVLNTKRLILRGFADRDLEQWARINEDPETTRYVGGTLDVGDAWRNIAQHLGHWTLRGFGNWALELRETGEVVGRAGLYEPADWPAIEAGWMLGRPWWGHGLATEAGLKVLEWATDVLRLSRIESFIHPDNEASARVAHRLGETYQRRMELRGVDVFVYGKTLRPLPPQPAIPASR